MDAAIDDEVLVCVVIINFRTAQLTIDCLETLVAAVVEIDCRINVVDNCSGDDSVAQIGSWIETNDKASIVRLLSSPVNGGFSYGNNFGIKDTRARYYLLLNSDTLVRPGALERLIEAECQFPDAGIISPRLEWEDGQQQVSCFRYHSPVSEFCSALQTGFIDRMLDRFQVSLDVLDIPSFPQWTSFACVLIKREVIDAVGLLDEGYFMYFEDAEYCYRARKHGWKVLNIPQARIVHLRGGSSPVKENVRLKKRLPKYFHESRSRFLYQLYGHGGLMLANAFWNLGRSISKCRQLLGSKDKVAIEKQWKDIWTNWLNPLKANTHPDEY
jgi:N-acetylglucosaminyl-diphospho-decaprenol L-rhamnosyltransferase